MCQPKTCRGVLAAGRINHTQAPGKELATHKPAAPHILMINGGSSSIKFALFESADPLKRVLDGSSSAMGRVPSPPLDIAWCMADRTIAIRIK